MQMYLSRPINTTYFEFCIKWLTPITANDVYKKLLSYNRKTYTLEVKDNYNLVITHKDTGIVVGVSLYWLMEEVTKRIGDKPKGKLVIHLKGNP